jgi:hypothetical protein
VSKEPEGGFYLLVADARPVSAAKTRIDLYYPIIGHATAGYRCTYRRDGLMRASLHLRRAWQGVPDSDEGAGRDGFQFRHTPMSSAGFRAISSPGVRETHAGVRSRPAGAFLPR